MHHKSWNKQHKKHGKTVVIIKQGAHAHTGQGGNAIAINASDVGVVRTKVQP